jgi:hypothetical protein
MHRTRNALGAFGLALTLLVLALAAGALTQ